MTAKGLGNCLFGSIILHLVLCVLAARMPTETYVALRAVEAFVVEPPGVRSSATGAPKPAYIGNNGMQRPAPEADRREPLPPLVGPAASRADRDAGTKAPSSTAPHEGGGPVPGMDPAHVALKTPSAGPLSAHPPGEKPGGAQPVPTGQEPGAGRIMALGDVGAPRFTHRETPIYPFMARRLGKEGRVVLRLALDARGRLQGIDTVEANGFGFAEAASAAIRKSTFAPAVENGRAVSSQVLVPVRFVLRERQ